MHESHVTILMATYNGESFLVEQLNSIINQTHKNWTIIASDDGSNDNTVSILKKYGLEIHHSQRQGFAANFLSLISKARTDSSYYAFADQDDVWDINKLSRALTKLSSIPKGTPALYCGRTHLVDKNLMNQGYSTLFKKAPSFKNALVQSIAGGNTMVLNSEALALLKQTPNYNSIVAHDWWAYLLISGAGGSVHYDDTPYIHYRQHHGNLAGSNVSWLARLHRIRMLFKGQLKDWIDLNNNNLLAISHLLTPENKLILDHFQEIRRSRFIFKPIKMALCGIYRQTFYEQIGLITGAFFNKI